jgi:diguanylate cyclase (GGDEF)-like protein
MVRARHVAARSYAPFAGAALLAYLLVPIGTHVRWAEYALSLAVMGCAAVLGARRRPAPGPAGARLGPSLAFVLAAALLRDAAGGSSAGVGILPLLPLFWIALHGSRLQLSILLAVTAGCFLAPVLAFGAPAYPAWTLRTGALLVVTGGIVGFTVQRLVADGRLREAQLGRLAQERAELALRLESLAVTDPLTLVGNRRAWDAWLEEAMPRAARADEPLCVALLDLDRFKRYNDRGGHPRGDELLREAARRWTDALRPGDRIARYGGEEFAVLLPGCDGDEALAAIERLRTLTPDGQTCSAGIAAWNGVDDPVTLLAAADAALYAAKRAGRDRTTIAGQPAEGRASRRPRCSMPGPAAR